MNHSEINIGSITPFPEEIHEFRFCPMFQVQGTILGSPFKIDLIVSLDYHKERWHVVEGPKFGSEIGYKHWGDKYKAITDFLAEEIFKTDLYRMLIVMNS